MKVDSCKFLSLFYFFSPQRYNFYKLALIDPDNGCNITDATWDAIKAEATSYGVLVTIRNSVRVGIG